MIQGITTKYKARIKCAINKKLIVMHAHAKNARTRIK